MILIFIRSEVEMDKRRRDVTKNNEWWWRDLYDQDGEIGYMESFKACRPVIRMRVGSRRFSWILGINFCEL